MAAKITPRDIPEKVTENQRKIIGAIIKNSNIIITELGQLVGISERKIKGNISKLKVKEIIRRIAPDKGGHWKIIKE
ncbi:MAG: hypothetical protein HYT97_08840 [Elusimicrobia bacterium]|nr:hypothetical protein [Elusimicrobiota bacterium]